MAQRQTIRINQRAEFVMPPLTQRRHFGHSSTNYLARVFLKNSSEQAQGKRLPVFLLNSFSVAAGSSVFYFDVKQVDLQGGCLLTDEERWANIDTFWLA